MFKLYLDPGHGRVDPGAIGNGMQEKEITLNISHSIRNLGKPLSIHVNAFNGSAHGYEDYIYNSLSDSSRTALIRDIMHEEIVKVNNLHNRGKK
jgi:N-acetylmuramoyl-L-alanine amidase